METDQYIPVDSLPSASSAAEENWDISDYSNDDGNISAKELYSKIEEWYNA